VRSKRGHRSKKKKPDGEVLPCDVSVENLEKRHTYLHTFQSMHSDPFVIHL
jgi:hypothetical protein